MNKELQILIKAMECYINQMSIDKVRTMKTEDRERALRDDTFIPNLFPEENELLEKLKGAMK